jgi:hypothetical protein
MVGMQPINPSILINNTGLRVNFPFIHTSVARAVGPSVTTSSTDFSFQNLVFGNLFEFSAAEIA